MATSKTPINKGKIVIAGFIGLILTILVEVLWGGLPVGGASTTIKTPETTIMMSGYSEFVIFTILSYFVLGKEMTKKILDVFSKS
ncbi:hypothetical protein KKA03_06465 [archaeon]|nr:hypothetical protein [archaeon]